MFLNIHSIKNTTDVQRYTITEVDVKSQPYDLTQWVLLHILK